ncbi:MAG: hypothetical protein ACR2J3_06800 [Aridibacter sp.]
MKQSDLPQRWQETIKNYLLEIGPKYKSFGVSDFNYDLKIDFDDGSNAFFHYAFYMVNKEWREIAVFTKHNGYHIFPLLAVKVETIDKKNKEIIKTEDFTIE